LCPTKILVTLRVTREIRIVPMGSVCVLFCFLSNQENHQPAPKYVFNSAKTMFIIDDSESTKTTVTKSRHLLFLLANT
jgi:hypothetical protein